VAILGSTTIAITGIDIDEKLFHTANKVVDEEVIKLLSLSMDKDAQKKQRKQKAKEQVQA
jgi:hypothetical protein